MDRLPVASSNLVSVGYETDTQTLEVEFKWSIYRYFDVPSYVYEELMNATSKGSYHHQNIKSSYQYERV